MQSLDDDLLFVLYDVARIMRVHTDKHAHRTGMTRAQWVLLAWLQRRPGITQNELAGLVEVEPITVTRLVDRLEKHGVVERRLDPADRRLRRLYLTPAASPLLEIIHAYRRDLAGLMSRGIESADSKRVLAALNQMKLNILDEKRDCAEAG
jgi:MarR family transcriptional regulator for hemolysin